jgi:hypothetical protein
VREVQAIGVALGAGWLATLGAAAGTAGDGWAELKSTHFVVRHRSSPSVAAGVARQAETCYNGVVELLGLSRRGGFWLWESRVTITVYPSRQEFLEATGAPGWAGGKADAGRREIAGFHPGGDLLERLLPHEMTHLVFRDSVKPAAPAPRWFEEGVAELVALRAGGKAMTGPEPSAWLPLGRLTAMDVAAEKDGATVALYYRQAAALVGYLVEVHGTAAFQRLCRALRTAESFEAALRRSHSPAIRDVAGLEAAWRAHREKGERP